MAPRHRNVDCRLLDVLGQLTDRDRLLGRLLNEHRVLTTSQVADVGLTGDRRARMRLGELYDLAIVDRVRPRAQVGWAPNRWVLGPVGAALVAAERGIETADLDWRKGMLSDLAAQSAPRPPGRHQRRLHRPHPLRLCPSRLPARGVVVRVGRGCPPRRLRRLGRPRHHPALPPRIRQRHRDPRAPGRQASRLRRARPASTGASFRSGSPGGTRSTQATKPHVTPHEGADQPEIAIAGGHGQIALRLTALPAARGDEIEGLIRNPDHAAGGRAAGASAMVCDLESRPVTGSAYAMPLRGANRGHDPGGPRG